MDTIDLTTQNQPGTVPSSAPQPQPSQAMQPTPSVGSGNKEYGPVAQRTEVVRPAPSETVPHIPKELRDLGIEESPDTDKPDVPPDAQKAGVQPVKTAAPVVTAPVGVIQVQEPPLPTPMTQQQAVANLKSHKADESISWLSMLSKYVLAKFGFQKVME